MDCGAREVDLEDIVDGGFLRKQEKSLDEQMAIDVQSRDFTYEDDEEEGVDLKGGSLHNDALTDLLLLPYKPVEKMELERFLGRWYEIARIPNRWQASGDYTTVSYLKNPHTGRLRILSKTYIDGRRHEQSGRLWVMDSTKNSTYKVQFRWPFTGVFWVLHIGEKEDYGFAVIGDPIKCNLWILSRTPFMEDCLYEKLLAQLEWQGYNIDKLVRSTQSEDLSLYDEEPQW